MLVQERQIEASELRPGMYVSRLDRPWTDTPFPLQGVMLKNAGDVEEVQRYSRNVWIDEEKSTPEALGSLPVRNPFARVAPGADMAQKGKAGGSGLDAGRHSQEAFNDEIPRARKALQLLAERATGVLDRLRSGHAVTPEQVEEVVQPVIQSLQRNPDAFFWLEALRSRHHYTYSHAVNCCALAAAFGRYLNFTADELKSLATGGLLLDIGMGAVPPEFVNHEGELDDIGRHFVKQHVRFGVERLESSGITDPNVLAMMQFHHENFDGSGYPGGKNDDAVPMFGRIAALIDRYDAMTSERPYRPAMSRAEALQTLMSGRGQQFQPDLVEQFVRCLGVYPVGTLVELNTGEVGMVMAQNPSRRLRPRLMMLTNPQKQLRAHFIPVNLADTKVTPSLEAVHIVRSLAPGSHGLDPRELYL